MADTNIGSKESRQELANTIARDLDSGNVESASAALSEQVQMMSAKEYQEFAQSISKQESKGNGYDLSLSDDIIETRVLGTVISVSKKTDDTEHTRQIATILDNHLAKIWDPLYKEKEEYLAGEVQRIAKILDSGDMESASGAINSLMRSNDQLGYGQLFRTLGRIQESEKKGEGFDLERSRIRRDSLAHEIVLTKNGDGESISRTVGYLDWYTAIPKWLPSKAQVSSADLTNPYKNPSLNSPLYSSRELAKRK